MVDVDARARPRFPWTRSHSFDAITAERPVSAATSAPAAAKMRADRNVAVQRARRVHRGKLRVQPPRDDVERFPATSAALRTHSQPGRPKVSRLVRLARAGQDLVRDDRSPSCRPKGAAAVPAAGLQQEPGRRGRRPGTTRVAVGSIPFR